MQHIKTKNWQEFFGLQDSIVRKMSGSTTQKDQQRAIRWFQRK